MKKRDTRWFESGLVANWSQKVSKFESKGVKIRVKNEQKRCRKFNLMEWCHFTVICKKVYEL